MKHPISRYPVPALAALPQDIRDKMLAVQEKAGFIPNVFLTLAHRPDEIRAFFAYHDALMLRESGLSKAELKATVDVASAPTLFDITKTRNRHGLDQNRRYLLNR